DAASLRKALHLAHVRHDLEQAQRRLAEFPDGLARSKGDEQDRIAGINERLSELNARRVELERNRDQAIAERDATGLGELPANEGVVQSLRDQLDGLRKIDSDLTGLQRDLQSARAERESNQRRLAAEIS